MDESKSLELAPLEERQTKRRTRGTGGIAKSSSVRRQLSDKRLREANLQRVGSWLDADTIGDLEFLLSNWPFKDRSQAISVAIRNLALHTRGGLRVIEV